MTGARRFAPLAAAVLLLAPGCYRETSTRLEDRKLGIAVQFPGQPRLEKYHEPTPFGDMEWFSNTCSTSGRLDRSFFVNVGNLPPGQQGGSSAGDVLATFRDYLEKRLGRLDVAVLPATRGAGFRYQCRLSNGAWVTGIVILGRGRLHQAQATADRPEDSESKAFLESFRLLP